MAERDKRPGTPIILLILDGWGLAPTWRGNAISFTTTPTMDRLWQTYPHTILHSFQPLIQTKRRQIGNSEISHAMLGAGRLLQSDLEEISQAIRQGIFAKNPTLLDAFRVALQKQRPLHLLGLASTGGIHSDLLHLEALLKLAKAMTVKDVYLHLILDGVDTPPTSGLASVAAIEKLTHKIGVGQIASLIGRFYGMDRGGHWDRTLVAYNLWTKGQGTRFAHPTDAVRAAYEAGVSDVRLPASRIDLGNKLGIMTNHDSVIVWNTRSDRIRQLVRSFLDPSALRPVLVRQAPLLKLSKFVTLVSPRLAQTLPLDVAFPPGRIPTTLAEVLAGRGFSQLRVAESEKYPHVTYFFNGGREEPFPGEERLIVPSPKVASFDQTPGMATPQLVAKVQAALRIKHTDVVVVNLGNVDLVGHTGNLLATAQAITIADQAVNNLATLALEQNGTLIVTADHGNAEQMLEVPGRASDQTHTINPVPFILVSAGRERDLLQQAVTAPPTLLADIIRSRATLADVAPTILNLLDIPIPIEMTGQSLLDQLK